jgi:cysteine-S-conjugate beta-lyase
VIPWPEGHAADKTGLMGQFAWASREQLRSRTSVKWQFYDGDVLPLWVAEMDVEVAPSIGEALRGAIARGDTGYAWGTVYAEAFAGFAAQRWGWSGIDVERTAVVPDVMLGAVELLRLLTGPGDAVVVCPPVYGPFFAFVAHAERRLVEAPLGVEGRLDLDALDRAFQIAVAGGRRAAFLLCNPHNPTGSVPTRVELESVAQLARRHGVRVVADEIHGPLVLPGAAFTPYLSVDGSEDACVLTSASKAWNLAGLKSALALAGPEAADDLARLPEEVSHGVSHVGTIAHVAAFATSSGWLDELLAALDVNRALLRALLVEHLPSVRFKPPDGTYFAWLDSRDLGLHGTGGSDGLAAMSDLSGPAQFFFDHARVALTSGHVFGTGGDGFARLNFATSPELLTEAVTKMGAAIAHR